MARSHVVKYFLEVEHQYMEMLDDVKELKDLVNENKLTQDDYNLIVSDINRLKENYERLAYIMFLLNKPKRKDARVDRETLSWYKVLKGSSKEAIINENNDALKTFKELIKKGELKDVEK